MDDDEIDEYAELWGVEPEEVEALFDAIATEDFEFSDMSQSELTDYIDSLYDQLTGEGWELDVSDLWDMYYGYSPGAK